MVAEILTALCIHPGGRWVDGTLGSGSLAASILSASSPTGWLCGCDRDGAAIEAATRRLAEFAGRFEIRRGNFADLGDWVARASCDGVVLDLGVSSPQLDQPERGFSFQHDAPLDMRMDDRQSLTAAEVVNAWDEAELVRIFQRYGGEPRARRIAWAIARERQARRIETTGQLAGLIERWVPRHGKKRHPATKVFLAVRMAVNSEVGSLQSGLAAACTLLKRGGRLAVVTFHSYEDRLVKEFGREQTRDYTFPGLVDVPELRQPRAPALRWVQRKAVLPGETEVAANPRARSAQLRVLERL
jgi:16S rRNA (cytosine1402-N4)-methyltransferase